MSCIYHPLSVHLVSNIIGTVAPGMESMVAIEEITEGRRMIEDAITNTIQMISLQMTVIDVVAVDRIMIEKAVAITVNTRTSIAEMRDG